MKTGGWEEIQDLATASLSGDAEKYRKFLALIAQKLKPRFFKILPASYVEDALQETLLAIHKSLHTLDTSRAVGPWVNAIAHYKIQDQLREIYKTARNVEYQDGLVSEKDDSNSVFPVNTRELLAKLPERDRKILELLKVQELSVKEVSNQMGISVSNVKVITFRALQKLRSLVAEEEFNEDR